MTRPALGAVLGYAVASPAPLAAAAQLGLLFGIAYCIGRVLALLADALLNGWPEDDR